jgi:hypothetical protein
MKNALTALAVMCIAVASASASDWDSRYVAPGNQTVHCTVSITGDTGTYTLDDGTAGDLSNITYTPSGKISIIRGQWFLNGDTGTFEWRTTPNGAQFLGRWKGDVGGSGPWNGSRLDTNNGTPLPGKPKRP